VLHEVSPFSARANSHTFPRFFPAAPFYHAHIKFFLSPPALSFYFNSPFFFVTYKLAEKALPSQFFSLDLPDCSVFIVNSFFFVSEGVGACTFTFSSFLFAWKTD